MAVKKVVASLDEISEGNDQMRSLCKQRLERIRLELLKLKAL